MLKITPIEGEREPYRSPDLIWSGNAGDIAINALSHTGAPGDLRAEQGLATQVLICLMTDRRVEASELRDGDYNRGWIGSTRISTVAVAALGDLRGYRGHRRGLRP